MAKKTAKVQKIRANAGLLQTINGEEMYIHPLKIDHPIVKLANDNLSLLQSISKSKKMIEDLERTIKRVIWRCV